MKEKEIYPQWVCSLLNTSEEFAPRKGPRRHGIKVLNIEIARPITL